MNDLNSTTNTEFQEPGSYCLLQNVVYIPSQEEHPEHLILQPESPQQREHFPETVELIPRNEMLKNTQIDAEVIGFEDSHDDPLADLLKSWNLFEDLYTFLTSVKGITVEGLKYIKSRHLDEIFGGQKINQKIILEHKVSCWQNEQGVYNLRSRQEAESCRETSDTCDTSDTSEKFLHEKIQKIPYSVHHILSNSEQGKSVLQVYNETKMLSPQARTYIVHTVIDCVLEHGNRLTVKKCRDLADQINSLFPTECRDTYFSQTNKKLPPKGKLWDRYQGRKRFLSKLNQNPKRLKLDSETNISTTNIGNEDCEQMCADLKHVRDWDTVLKKWKETVSYRKNRLFNFDLNLHQILDEWPLFKYSKAPNLVDIDYQFSFPENELNFSKWDDFCKKSSDLFDQRIKDPQSKLLKKRVFAERDTLNTDNFNIYVMMLLHSVLLPSGKIINGRRTKFTIADSQKAFTVLVRQSSEVDEVVAEKKKQCMENNCTLQPFVIAVGNEFNFKNFYVTLDGIKYAFNSYIEAVQYCFKLMFVLNLKYPNECTSVWKFLERYLFNIKTNGTYPIINTFINDINNLTVSK